MNEIKQVNQYMANQCNKINKLIAAGAKFYDAEMNEIRLVENDGASFFIIYANDDIDILFYQDDHEETIETVNLLLSSWSVVTSFEKYCP